MADTGAALATRAVALGTSFGEGECVAGTGASWPDALGALPIGNEGKYPRINDRPTPTTTSAVKPRLHTRMTQRITVPSDHERVNIRTKQ